MLKAKQESPSGTNNQGDTEQNFDMYSLDMYTQNDMSNATSFLQGQEMSIQTTTAQAANFYALTDQDVSMLTEHQNGLGGPQGVMGAAQNMNTESVEVTSSMGVHLVQNGNGINHLSFRGNNNDMAAQLGLNGVENQVNNIVGQLPQSGAMGDHSLQRIDGLDSVTDVELLMSQFERDEADYQRRMAAYENESSRFQNMGNLFPPGQGDGGQLAMAMGGSTASTTTSGGGFQFSGMGIPPQPGSMGMHHDNKNMAQGMQQQQQLKPESTMSLDQDQVMSMLARQMGLSGNATSTQPGPSSTQRPNSSQPGFASTTSTMGPISAAATMNSTSHLDMSVMSEVPSTTTPAMSSAASLITPSFTPSIPPQEKTGTKHHSDGTEAGPSSVNSPTKAEAAGNDAKVSSSLATKEKKDETYWEKRRKNNESAKRSREARRNKEQTISLQVLYLEQDNIRLITEIDLIRADCRTMISELKRRRMGRLKRRQIRQQQQQMLMATQGFDYRGGPSTQPPPPPPPPNGSAMMVMQ